MKIKKKYICMAVVCIVILINLAATTRLVFSVVYPERLLKEVVTEYFKKSLDKAVKFEDLYIDFAGNIIISDFDISITSDFNDNISLVRSSKAVIDLDCIGLLHGSIGVDGIDFYKSEITILKKYGKSHLESLEQLLNPARFIKQATASRPDFYLHVHNARVYYRETLHDKQVAMELHKVDASMELDKTSFSYEADGAIQPYKTETIHRGSFSIRGTVDMGKGDAFSHRVRIDNIDLTYFNEYLAEYKALGISLEGGGSVDLDIGRSKGTLSIKGSCETNNMTVLSLEKKHNLIANENLDLELDLVIKPGVKSYTARTLNLRDDTFTIESSGSYTDNDASRAVRVSFKTNSIDLGDLSQNFTPLRDIEYGGTLRGEGTLSLDLKNNSAAGTKIAVDMEDFTVHKIEKKGEVTLLDESGLSLKLDEKALSVDIKARPLKSDVGVQWRTAISNWVPFRSETKIAAGSRRLNLENLRHTAVFFVECGFESAYEDKRGATEKVPFLQTPLGKFLNNNTIDLSCSAATVFYGRKSRWNNFLFNTRLERGALLVRDFGVEGYEADYRFGGQAYFNTDQPYVKLDGKIDNFDFAAFYADSGMKGAAGGTARCEFSFEVSVARIGDMLNNAKGSLNVYVGKGTMTDTKLQQTVIRFLNKNGYSAGPLSAINYEDISFSASQQGENFWFSNFTLRGDSFQFSAIGDYMYEAGISSSFGATIRTDASSTVVPLNLSGPILAPCIEVPGKKDSRKLCF